MWLISAIVWLNECDWVIKRVGDCYWMYVTVCNCVRLNVFWRHGTVPCETTKCLTASKHLPRRNFTCRIISVEGTKAVINSTITPNMTFTKTSQKFGQWSDVRANTVYGLGRYTALRCSCDQCCGSSVPDPWHFGVDPDPRIHASD